MENSNIVELSSYEEFVAYFKHLTNMQGVSWNNDREIYMNEDINKKKIILQEIHQFDFKVGLYNSESLGYN
jgi:hypothetical protein